MATHPPSQARGVDPLSVQRRQRLLACVPSPLESALFAEAADRELDPLAQSGGERPERQPIAALDGLIVMALEIDVTTYSREARLVVAALDLAILSARHRRMPPQNFIAKRLSGVQRLALASVRTVGEAAPPDLVSPLNGDDPRKRAMPFAVDPGDRIAGASRGSSLLISALANHCTHTCPRLRVASGLDDFDAPSPLGRP